MNAFQFASEVMNMHYELMALREEVEELREYKRKYHELLGESLQHSQSMAGNMIKMLLVPGVAKAFQDNAKASNFEGQPSAASG